MLKKQPIIRLMAMGMVLGLSQIPVVVETVHGAGNAVLNDSKNSIFPDKAPSLSLQPPPPPLGVALTSELNPGQSAGSLILPNEYLNIDVLLVIYTHSATDTINAQEIQRVVEEVSQGELFYFRNSRCRLDLNISTQIIDRNLTLDQFWLISPPGGYWLTFWETDGAHSVRNDLYNLGYYNNQFAGVFVYYAWANSDDIYAALGGGTYGVDAGFMGQTAFSSVPLCWDPETNDWYFIHEFHHQLDNMFSFSGHPEYPHADFPGDYSGIYDDDYSFNGWIIRDWPLDQWGDMSSSWGSILTFTDSDNDSIPDIGDGFTITEQEFGSSPLLIDTDSDLLNDLGEAAAGYSLSSDPLDSDTDGDSIADGSDNYPVDPVLAFLPFKTHTVDGTMESSWQKTVGFHAPDTIDMRSELSVSYCDTGIFMVARVYDDMIQTPWDDPWWDDGIYIQIDAQDDGYLWHGDDNYSVYISPRGARYSPLRNMGIYHPDGSRDTGFIPSTDLTAAYLIYSGYYVIEAFIKFNSLTNFNFMNLGSLRMQVDVIDYDTYPGWPHYSSFSKFIGFQKQGWISGVAVDSSLLPISSVQVSCVYSGSYDTTGTDGQFYLQNIIPGSNEIHFEHVDYYDTSLSDVVVLPGDTSTIQIVLRSLPGYLRGLVTDQYYEPIQNAIAQIAGTEITDTTDAAGIFFIEGLIAGFYELTLTCPTFFDTSLSQISISPGDTSQVNVIMRSIPGHIGGIVTTQEPQPITGVVVSALGTDVNDTTDLTGAYLLRLLNVGIHDISFLHPTYMETTAVDIVVTSGDTTLLNMILSPLCQYLPGDMNGFGGADGIDVVYGVSYLKGGAPPTVDCNPPCTGQGDPFYAAMDVNGDCQANGIDITYFVSYLKGTQPALLYCPDCEPAGRAASKNRAPIINNPQ